MKARAARDLAAILHRRIEEQAGRTPNAVAVRLDGMDLTYGELDARANGLARLLRREGVAPGVRVAICAERSLGLVVGLLGTLKAGGAYVPIDPDSPRERLDFLLTDAAAPVVLTQARLASRLPTGGGLRIELDEWEVAKRDIAPPELERRDPEPAPDDPAYVIYTSGSTGRPKGAINSHRGIDNRLVWMQEAFALGPGDRVLQKTPFSFDVSVWEFFWPLRTGARLVLARPGGHRDPAYLLDLIVREGITTLHFVPPMLRAFLEHPGGDRELAACAATLCRVICSGEALPAELVDRFFSRLPGVELHNLYGPTEAAVDVTWWRCDPAARTATVPIGLPIANTGIHILDPVLEAVPVGEEGELCIAGVQVGGGYLNRPDLTAERFLPDPSGSRPGDRLYRTGDLARQRSDGAFEFLGRLDFQVKVRGFRIELGEIEAALDLHPGVAGSVVVAEPGPGGETRLVAYLRPALPRAATLRRWLELERKGLLVGHRFHELPDGTVIAHHGRGETEFLWREIFAESGYLRHGIELRDGDCVFDVGANIGLFSLFAGRQARVRIHAFEPLPPLIATLGVNARLHGLDLRLHPCAVGERSGSADLTFYPHATLISGRFADFAEDQEVIRTFLAQDEQGRELTAQERAELIEERLLSERHTCPLRTLSEVIAEEGIERIDLLKIDVEKGERAVLAGLAEADWPKVLQVVVEVHDADPGRHDGSLLEITSLLRRHGFEVEVEQEGALAGSGLHNVYARRPGRRSGRRAGMRPEVRAPKPPEPLWTRPEQLIADVRERLRERLPEPMVPAAYVVLEEFPLNPNGKVDRKALPAPKGTLEEPCGEQMAPRTPVEAALAAIWEEVLEVRGIGREDSFLDLGGHSLLAMQVMARVRERLGVDLVLPDLFEDPLLSALAARVAERARALSPSPLLPVPRTGDLPLSFAQERVWFLQQLDPGIRSYQFQARLCLHGRLEAEALRRSLAAIVRRHEIFRTTFPVCAEGPVQRFHPESVSEGVRLPCVDLSALPSELREAEAERVRAQENAAPFDLDRLPLIRWVLVRLAPDDHLWLHGEHHLVHDGWSFNRLLGELAAFYRAEVEGVPSSLPELPLQFADWAVWQRRWMAGAEAASQIAEWRRILAGRPALLELPTDRPRPKRQSFQGAIERLEMPPALCITLRAASRRLGISLYMLMQAAFATLLARLSGQRGVNVGTAVANRRWRETEPILGMLVDNVVLAHDLPLELSVSAALGRVRKVCLEAVALQEIPFDLVVEALRPERDLAYNPLFQASFSFHDSPLEEIYFPGLRAELAEGLSNGSAKFDLNAIAIPRGARQASLAGGGGEGITLLWEYATALFDRASMVRRIGSFFRLLEGFAGDGGARLGDLRLLSEEEERQIGRWSSGGPAPAAGDAREVRSVIAAIEARAEREPHRLALAGCGRRLSYGELEAAANRLAWRLLAAGVGPESRVAVCLERSPELPLALLAVLKAGGAYLPLDPIHPAERLAYILDDAAAAVLVTSSELARRLNVGAARCVLVDGNEASPAMDTECGRDDRPVVQRGELAYVIYTSGSTGRPKGTELTHAGLGNLVAWHRAAYSLAPDDRATLVASPAFDAAVWEIWPALAAGASLHVPPEDLRAAPAALLAWMAEERITVSFLPTPLAQACLDLEPEACDGLSLRVLLTGGDRLHRVRRELPFRLVNHYGPTEATVVTTAGDVATGPQGDDPPSLGGPIAGFTLHVLDTAMAQVPEGVVGELWVGGVGLGRGYLGRPQLTAERFVPDPFAGGEAPGTRLYRSGDRVRWRDGRLDFVGRADDQVKVRGFRIELGEIEAELQGHPEVRAAAVLVRGQAREGANGSVPPARLVAYVVPRNGETLQAELPSRLRDHLRSRLPEVMVPASIALIPSLPLSPHGKVDRNALEQLPESSPSVEAAPLRPWQRTPAEELLAGIWSELLQLPAGTEIAPDAGFFELGGHSLLATRMTSRIRTLLGIEMPLSVVFEAPALSALAKRIERAREGDGEAPLPPLVRLPRGGPLPVSFSQQRLWFLDRLEPGSVAYNLSRVLLLRGAVLPAALGAALGAIVGRHEALRTVILEQSGEPWQVVAAPSPPALPVIDLSALPEALRLLETRRIATDEARRPYELARGPLLRASLLLRGRIDGETEQALLLGFHHVIADGWSLSILVSELGELLRACGCGGSAVLPSLPIQYADFAVWQRRCLTGGRLEERLAWWSRLLAGAPQVDLPLDRPRPCLQSYRGRRARARFGAPETIRFEGASRRLGVTPFMAFFAALGVLLSRYGGQEDVVVGTPIANRGRSEVEDLIGYFANTLALRLDLSGDPAFAELAHRVREAALGAYTRQDLPFERLVDELRPERSLSHSPVFQVLLAYKNLPDPRFDLPGMSLSLLEFETGRTQFDLAFYIDPLPEGGLLARASYASDLFDAGTIERMLDHLLHLLSAVAELGDHPERRLSELPLLRPEERAALLALGRGPALDVEGLLHQPFEVWARERPGATAISGEGGSLTYGELNLAANRLAQHLRRLGIGAESRVAVCLERSPLLVTSFLAVLKAGGAFVPLDPALPEERRAWILADSGAGLLIGDRSDQSAPLGFAGATLLLDQLDLSGELDSEPSPVSGPENLAYVLYTSGSTGRPKGVAVRQRGAASFLASMRQRPGCGPDDVLLAVTTVSFDIALLELFLPLSCGARVELAGRTEAADGFRLRRRLEVSGTTMMQATPATWRLLLEAGWVGGPDLRILCGGEALPPDLGRELLARSREVWNLYGPTETTVWSAAHRVAKDEAGERAASRPIPLGVPIGNTEIHLLGRFRHGLEPLPPGAPGELYIGGEGLARGYLNRPDTTAEHFVPDPFSGGSGGRLYRTGDVARRRIRTGELEFLGRTDHQVKVRGFRIELGEIEVCLGSYPAVREGVVVARETAPGSLGLAAYLVFHDGAVCALGAVQSFLRQRLPDYMVPSAWTVLAALPLTANGKVDRNALPAPGGGVPATPSTPPRSPLEIEVARTWCEVLGVERVGREDRFWDLGGHSLLATRVLARLSASFGVDVPLQALFQTPTLGGFSATLAEAVMAAISDDEMELLSREL